MNYVKTYGKESEKTVISMRTRNMGREIQCIHESYAIAADDSPVEPIVVDDGLNQ